MYDTKSITYIRYEAALTLNHIYASPARVGRKKEFDERITLPLSAEMLAKLDSFVTKDENRLAIIREALEREIKRRERLAK